LIQRKDDNEATLQTRLTTYENETSPLVEYYQKQGIFYTVNGMLPLEEVCSGIKAILTK